MVGRAGAFARVAVDVRLLDDEVRLEVRDNGHGIPDDVRDAVFVRGFSTKEEVLGGRGLGLALVQLICGQRGGSVEADRDGPETSFRVRLPVPERVGSS